MIVLDTHIWVWWATRSEKLSVRNLKTIESHIDSDVVVSAISLWEVGLKASLGKLELGIPFPDWSKKAIAISGVRLVQLLPEFIEEAVSLPKPFHRDPADQLIVATARRLAVPLLTADQRILDYPHVEHA